ncbi:hypothetical protein HBI56_179100 [Parastagonospora nodorum]|uniref:Uncharacterized protein n=2 Tax=Phaeosphaeria nodorum (strain SN15 / ATCC MYA-4574 / FGSC 10173) TaxID=321614 RepID=A0A7U2EVF7_PHANO|nr:hypothetical protein SNOG_08317 [Parastagonospora nodorum SN15]KAH3917892.1 hypothetical protein HBH56_046200 [Parastagonospora nodorum]EAT84593.1 hypothetical protein SNOG_08317 [Parastagonospora nodorum SN15]KAH3932900.1 hypothetical protein HBH54_073950 [Parastagonospora nodorum]KAH3946256.1 hypothetical protein HBH53_133090 [Parastagonospora nodorum]KAH3973127.1 hypothetical protein HBH52_146000 [Parastagonospora nodorum]
MAPDLNSVPTSPRPNVTSNPSGSLSRQSSTTASRRTSQIYPMSPPPLPLGSPSGTLPASAQGHGVPPLSPSMSGRAPSVDASGTPMRHPQPVTPAQIYLEMEKEQEAAVNRLTRELSALRTHSASVVSTGSIASSAASNAHLDNDSAHAGSMTGSMHPTPSRRHRSSSSVSRSGLPPGAYPHRYSVSSQQGEPSHRSSSVVSTPRYEEVAQQRAELEDVKRENEMLKQRIRDLERAIRSGDADAQRGRRGAPASTTEAAAAGASATEEGGTS